MKVGNILGTVFIGLIVIAAVMLMVARQSSLPPAPVDKPEMSLGDLVTIQSEGGSATVAADEESLNALAKVARAKDQIGYSALVFGGKVYSVENGTKVRLVEYGDGSAQVFITEGRFEGRYAWLPRTSVKPLSK